MGENRVSENTARDMPFLDKPTWIHYPSIQGRCASCKAYRTVRPKEIDERRRATSRLMLMVHTLCIHMPLSAVASFCEISSATAYRWDRAVLEQLLPKPQLDGLRVLLIDEKSVRKKHNYVTLVMNGDTGELLYMAEGKKKESLEGFFNKLTDEQTQSIEAVCIDRAGSYQEVIKTLLPKAEIVFDKFHLMMNLNAAVDEVRREEWHKASAQDKAFIKGQRYNLLRHEENLPLWAQESFRALRANNENLDTTYMLKEAFGLVWYYRQPKRARDYLVTWVQWVEQSAINPLLKFARGVIRDIESIVSFSKHRITNGKLEGFNNLVARVIHKACGVKNLQYLFLKLRQTSLPNLLQN